MPSDCIFCKIVRGEIPCQKIYEDKNVIAFLDINPVNKGHILVIPKEHYETILDIPEGLLGKLMIIVKKVDKTVLNAFEINACNIDINQGKDAGQIVPHLHIHIIPRFHSDNFKKWPAKKYDGDKEMKKIAEKIRNSL